MKRTSLFRMGHLGMGSLLSVFLVSVLICTSLSVLAQSQYFEDNDNDEVPVSGTRQNLDVWYIYRTKEIIDNRTFEWPIIINSTGEFFINNSATVTLDQKYDYQRNITIKDNGTLHLKLGSLVSNKKMAIKVKDNGKVILEKNSNLKVTDLVVNNNGLIQLSSSRITPGVGGLFIEINGNGMLDLIESEIINADEINSNLKTTIRIKNSDIHSKNYGINCKEFKLTSNQDFQNIEINRCEYGYILGSTVNNIKINSCGFMRISQNSKLMNSKIDDINELDIDNSEVQNLHVAEIDSTLSIRRSEISGMKINNCTILDIENSRVNNLTLNHYSYEIILLNTVLEQSSILPKTLNIYDSTINCNQAQLDVLTSATSLEAYNTSFNLPLKFTGNTIAELINCTTNKEIPPEVIVLNDATTDLYWWLNVKVVDSQNQPLPDAEITIFDFITENKIAKGVSDIDGKVTFELMANTITKNGWHTKENKSYFIVGKYNEHMKENSRPIFMEDNKVNIVKFDDVNKIKKETKPLIGTPEIIVILIIVLIAIIIAFSLTGKSKEKKNKTGNENNNKTKKAENNKKENWNGNGNGNGNSNGNGNGYNFTYTYKKGFSNGDHRRVKIEYKTLKRGPTVKGI